MITSTIPLSVIPRSSESRAGTFGASQKAVARPNSAYTSQSAASRNLSGSKKKTLRSQIALWALQDFEGAGPCTRLSPPQDKPPPPLSPWPVLSLTSATRRRALRADRFGKKLIIYADDRLVPKTLVRHHWESKKN